MEQKQHILDRKSSQAATTRNYQKTVFSAFSPLKYLDSSPLQERLSFFQFIHSNCAEKGNRNSSGYIYICKYFQFLWLKNRQEGCSSVKLFSFVCYIKDRLEDMDVPLVFCHFIFERFPWLHFLVSN